jgi:thiamine-monophosphate kinase
MNEFDRIATYFAPLAREPGAFGLRDDAALLSPPPGTSYILTKDCITEGVHFIGDEPANLLAQKLLRTNLSDLAAKGATPYGYLLGLMLPHATPDAWFAAFARGLAEDQERYGISLLGGDTTATQGRICLSLTAIGALTRPPLLRSGARVGDAVYVTGTLGDAALGLDVLQGKLPLPDTAFLIDRYRLPQPRCAIGPALFGIATAAMDISDGLLQDAGHLCRASHMGMVLRAEALPLSPTANAAMQQNPRLLQRVVAGGDDYELLFTAPKAETTVLASLAAQTQIAITCIGDVVAGDTPMLVDAHGAALDFPTPGYQHF